MNRVILTGRWTKDPELRYTPSGQAVVNTTIAVDRPPREGENGGADFISVVVWGKMAEAVAKHTNKGHLVGVDGRLQTRCVLRLRDNPALVRQEKRQHLQR